MAECKKKVTATYEIELNGEEAAYLLCVLQNPTSGHPDTEHEEDAKNRKAIWRAINSTKYKGRGGQ